MQSTSKSCLPLAGRHLFTAFLVIASIWNLGTMAAARAPAVIHMGYTPTPAATGMPALPSSVQVSLVSDTPAPPLGPAGIPTQTLSASFTPTSTATSTVTYSPTVTPCSLWDYWPAHIVQWGDTLYTLAHSTGSTVEELQRANCLPGDQMYAGQVLYVPRPPFRTPMPTPGAALGDTPAPTVPDTPASFQDPSATIPLCYYPYGIYFAVKASDVQGTRSVSAFYSINGGPLVEVPLSPAGTGFYGLVVLSGWEPAAGPVYYYFKLIDGLGYVSNSGAGMAALTNCTGS